MKMPDLTLNAKDVEEVERRVPVWAKIATLAVSLLTIGFGAHDLVDRQRDFEPRVAEIETHVEEAEPLLKYLVCKDLATESSACVFILRDSPYFEELRDLGLLGNTNQMEL